MSPERMAALVRRWVRLYTRDLPEPVARRRLDEIAADLHDHVEHERAAGTGERRIALGILSRLVRGLAADAAWRGRQAKLARPSTREHTMTTNPLRRPVVRVALGVAVLLAAPLVATLTGDADWSPADFVLAGILLAIIGAAFELAARRSGNWATAVGLAALGVVACLLGGADDAPGLVLLGLLLVASGFALGLRRAQRSR